MAVVALSVLGAGCSGSAGGTVVAPRCDAARRVGAVAQSVPGASFVPCVTDLPTGWDVETFRIRDNGTTMELQSDREERPVRVAYRNECRVGDATAVTPRDDGVRTYVRLRSIRERYAGEMIDVFPGGCVTYEFDFERGPHIALMDEMGSAVDLYPRWELRALLRRDFGINLDG